MEAQPSNDASDHVMCQKNTPVHMAIENYGTELHRIIMQTLSRYLTQFHSTPSSSPILRQCSRLCWVCITSSNDSLFTLSCTVMDVPRINSQQTRIGRYSVLIGLLCIANRSRPLHHQLVVSRPICINQFEKIT